MVYLCIKGDGFSMTRSMKFVISGLILAFLTLGGRAWASDTQIVGVPVINAPGALCPGDFFSVSITVQNTTNNGDEGRIQIAMSPNTGAYATCWTSMQNSI